MPAALPIELRERIVRAHSVQGMPMSEVARVFDVGRTSVRRFVKAASLGLSLHPGTAPGAKPKISDEGRMWLKARIQANPYLTSYELCALYNRAHRSNRVHRSTILRAMHELGYTHKRPS